MKDITVQAYTFDELSTSIQESLIDQYATESIEYKDVWQSIIELIGGRYFKKMGIDANVTVISSLDGSFRYIKWTSQNLSLDRIGIYNKNELQAKYINVRYTYEANCTKTHSIRFVRPVDGSIDQDEVEKNTDYISQDFIIFIVEKITKLLKNKRMICKMLSKYYYTKEGNQIT